jgi:hypothetical protein
MISEAFTVVKIKTVGYDTVVFSSRLQRFRKKPVASLFRIEEMLVTTYDTS